MGTGRVDGLRVNPGVWVDPWVRVDPWVWVVGRPLGVGCGWTPGYGSGWGITGMGILMGYAESFYRYPFLNPHTRGTLATWFVVFLSPPPLTAPFPS